MSGDCVRAWLDEHLATLVGRYGAPGAVVAAMVGDEVVESAAGVLDVRTGAEVTIDSVFAIGSITKVWTHALVMQLVDEDRIDVDVPVRTYLPGFAVADTHASAVITPRQLLDHTAGFEDLLEIPHLDDSLEQYVDEVLPRARQLYPPGQMYSYCNTGFAVLGRLIEVARGDSWARTLRRHLLEPLALHHVATAADGTPPPGSAIGHRRRAPQAPPEPVTGQQMWAAIAPAGDLRMSARDLLSFARMLLRDGVAPGDIQVLSAEGARAVRGRELSLFAGSDGSQTAFLAMLPQKNVAIVLLTNTGTREAERLQHHVLGHVTAALADFAWPALPGLDIDPAALVLAPVGDPARYAGRYTSASGCYRVEAHADGRLHLDHRPNAFDQLLGWPPTEGALVPVADDALSEFLSVDGDPFYAVAPDGNVTGVCVFVGADADGRFSFLHLNNQALPRTD